MTYVDWIVFCHYRAFRADWPGCADLFASCCRSAAGSPPASRRCFGLPLARPFANEKIGDPLFADIAAGVVIFVVTLILCSIIGHFISKRVQGSMLGPVDRSLGLLFGLVRGALVVSALALGIDYFWPPPIVPPPDVANAMTLPMASKGANLLRSLIPASLLGKAQESAAEVGEQSQMVIDVGQATGLLPEQLMPAAGPVGTGESAGSPDEFRV